MELPQHEDGYTVNEIADIAGVTAEEVEAAIDEVLYGQTYTETESGETLYYVNDALRVIGAIASPDGPSAKEMNELFLRWLSDRGVKNRSIFGRLAEWDGKRYAAPELDWGEPAGNEMR